MRRHRSAQALRFRLAVGVFLKRPAAGEVKTRLARDLGPERACQLYRRFVLDTLEWVATYRAARVTVFFDPPEAREVCREMIPPGASGFRLLPQRPGTLGERMARAFDEMFGGGARRALLIGTDCPLLERSILAAASDALKTSDLVLGPAADGGYYLVGLRRPCAAIFRGIAWSTAGVLRATLGLAKARGMSVALLPVLPDVDTAADLSLLWTGLLAAWKTAREGRRRDFPLRTFRSLMWEEKWLDRGVRSVEPRGTSGISGLRVPLPRGRKGKT